LYYANLSLTFCVFPKLFSFQQERPAIVETTIRGQSVHTQSYKLKRLCVGSFIKKRSQCYGASPVIEDHRVLPATNTDERPPPESQPDRSLLHLPTP